MCADFIVAKRPWHLLPSVVSLVRWRCTQEENVPFFTTHFPTAHLIFGSSNRETTHFFFHNLLQRFVFFSFLLISERKTLPKDEGENENRLIAIACCTHSFLSKQKGIRDDVETFDFHSTSRNWKVYRICWASCSDHGDTLNYLDLQSSSTVAVFQE